MFISLLFVSLIMRRKKVQLPVKCSFNEMKHILKGFQTYQLRHLSKEGFFDYIKSFDIKELLQMKGDCGWSVLIVALWMEDIATVQYLLENGAEIDEAALKYVNNFFSTSTEQGVKMRSLFKI